MVRSRIAKWFITCSRSLLTSTYVDSQFVRMFSVVFFDLSMCVRVRSLHIYVCVVFHCLPQFIY